MLQRYSMGSESISPRTPGKLDFGKPSRAITRTCFLTDPRFNASAEVLRGEKFIQIDGDVRKGERVIFAAHTTAKVPQQFVVNLREAMIVNEFMARAAVRCRKSAEKTFSNISTRDLNRSRI